MFVHSRRRFSIGASLRCTEIGTTGSPTRAPCEPACVTGCSTGGAAAAALGGSRPFEDFRARPFLPANEAYRDPTRQALDEAVLVELLVLPRTVLEPLALLRKQWCEEPTVHGGKATRP